MNYDELCNNVTEYIDTHIYTIVRLDSLSEVFGYNYCHLSCVFKKVTGMTMVSYYRSVRLAEAKKLLKKGTKVMKVSEILNYSSTYSFSRAFKKFWGMSPINYRKSNISDCNML